MHANFAPASYCLDGLSYKTKSRGTTMPSGHYKKVIDPRTRAEVAPEVVPFWHLKIAKDKGESSNSGGNTAYNRLVEEVEDALQAHHTNEGWMSRIWPGSKKLSWLQIIDLFSGMISVLALFLSWPGLVPRWKIDNDLQWPMWHENILCYNSSKYLTTETCINDPASFDLAFGNDSRVGMQYAYNTTNAALQNYCKNNQDYILPDNLGRNWNDTHYQCQVITQKHGGFYIWWALRLVFLISAIFQLTRFYLSKQDDNRYSPPRPKYFARKPDFWRWWEYALTSPIQIFIIGLSFFMGSQSELIALAGLQAALCFMGFIIEKRIDKLYKAKIKALQHRADQSVKTKDSILKYIKILVVLSAAWAFFVIIWDYILWPRFNRQANNPENCHYGDKMPEEVRFIVWAEYILFLLFGLTQTMQVILFVVETNYFPENFTNTNLMAHYWKNKREKRWYQFTMVYSILSITAKTLLEFGLLELSVRFSDMI